ncbi:hypothetical protein ACFOGI_05710 [Virgibacillus xinjiangensis]|uniref:Uncharacterized protein n=1 Tax=Virgibacillus xinjiangensis TaxID=393090 RepID=A0ABV7CTM8_9BACI
MTKTRTITEDMLARFHELHRRRKEIDQEMNQLKEDFHAYFDEQVGTNVKGELIEGNFKLQRQVRRSDRFVDDATISRLEELNMEDLIKVVKKPDGDKINAAVELGLLNERDLDGCKISKYSPAITVKEV